jgi:hypothetical protein
MPDIQMGQAAPAGYHPGATPAAAWTKSAPVSTSSGMGGGARGNGGSSSYASPNTGPTSTSGTGTVNNAPVNAGTPAAPPGQLRQVNSEHGQGPWHGPDTGGSIRPDTQKFINDFQKQFPGAATSIGGYRHDGRDEHPGGFAADLMIPDKATQDKVMPWILQQPNVNFALNQQKQWNPDGSTENMPNRGDATQNHFDHIHVNVASDVKPDPSATTSGPIKPLPGLKGLGDDDGSSGGSSAGDQTPGASQPMTLARRFALQYFAADKDKDDQEPGQNTPSSNSQSSQVTDAGAYGAGADANPANMDLSAGSGYAPASFSTPSGGGYSGGGGSYASPATPSSSGGGGSAAPMSSASPTGGPPSQSLTEALTRAGIPANMHGVIQGFSATEGNNPSGAPTLGWTDSQAGTTLDSHAQALAKQIHDRASVTGAFPTNGSPQDQASWMATLVGQNGSKSDWQGNAQPARSDYVNRIVKSMPAAAPVAPANGPSLPATGSPTPSMHAGARKSGAWLLEASRHVDS